MKITACVFVVFAVVASSQASILTAWNFNSQPISATSAPAASFGVGTASLVNINPGGVNFALGTGSSDPGFPNNGWAIGGYANQSQESGNRGIQFMTSTVGKSDIQVTWDQRNLARASKYVQFQYTIDGVNFLSSGLTNDGIFSMTTSWTNGNLVNLSSIAGVANNANFGFRIVSVFAPSGVYEPTDSTNTYNSGAVQVYDMVTVSYSPSVVPEPMTIFLSLAGAGAYIRRRRTARP